MTLWPSLLLLTVALLAPCAHGDFDLALPPTIGYTSGKENTSPCGSFTPSVSQDNVTDFQVGGDAILFNNLVTPANFLIRATLDLTAKGSWEVVVPSFVGTGTGDYCFPQASVPKSWSGSNGIIQVIQDGGVNINYQCSVVRFVSYDRSTPAACKNATGNKISLASDATFTSLLAASATTQTITPTAKAITVSPTPTTSAKSSSKSSSASKTASNTGSASTSSTGAGSTSTSSSSSGLSTGAKVGLGVGIPLGVIALAALFFIGYRYGKRRGSGRQPISDTGPGLGDDKSPGLQENKHNMGPALEMAASPRRQYAELDGGGARQVAELDGRGLRSP